MMNPSNDLNNQSPSSSKNSSSDSLNFILRKDGNIGPGSHQVNQDMLSDSIDYSLNNFNLSKKKSLKNTLYKMFTQRKKVQKFRQQQQQQKICSDNSFYGELATPGSHQGQNLTIKTESDKKIKKK